MVHTVCYFL